MAWLRFCLPCSPQRWRCAVVVRLRVTSSTPHCAAPASNSVSVRLSVLCPRSRDAPPSRRFGLACNTTSRTDVVHRDSQRLLMPARGNGGAVTVTAAGGNHRHKRSKRLESGTVTVTIDKQSQQRRKDVRSNCCPVLVSRVAPSGCSSLCPPLCSLIHSGCACPGGSIRKGWRAWQARQATGSQSSDIGEGGALSKNAAAYRAGGAISRGAWHRQRPDGAAARSVCCRLIASACCRERVLMSPCAAAQCRLWSTHKLEPFERTI